MQARLPFNNLNTFAAAAETLSFQDAAELLHVTPSAVSHQIRNLESLLGYKLFERLDKKIRLTRKGEQLFLDIRGPLLQLHDASNKAIHNIEGNVLSLSVAPIFATKWLLPRLKDFYRKHPQVSLSVVATTSIVDFRTDPFDAAIRIGQGTWHDTESELLFKRRSVAVCHPDVVKQNGGMFKPEELLSQPLIHITAIRDNWEDWFATAGIKTPKKLQGLEVQTTSQLLEVIDTGGTIGLVDPSFIHHDLEIGRLAIACEYIETCADAYYLSYPENIKTFPPLQAFEKWLVAQAKLAAKDDFPEH